MRNALEDKCVVAGAGDFESSCKVHLDHYADGKDIKESLTPCIKAFGDALMSIPKVLAESATEGGAAPALRHTLLRHAREAYGTDAHFGLDLESGCVTDPMANGIVDNMRVKRQQLEATYVNCFVVTK